MDLVHSPGPEGGESIDHVERPSQGDRFRVRSGQSPLHAEWLEGKLIDLICL